MANVYTYSGNLSLSALLKVVFTGDQAGTISADVSKPLTFAASGGDAVITGFFKGDATCAAGDWLMAHASDPLQAMGTAVYSPGFTVAGSKLKLLYVENLDATNSITIARGATNGLAIFDTAGDSVTIKPGGFRVWYDPAGITGALSTGSNDKATVSVSGGSPTAKVVAMYGS
jgi:hypothetical protein